MKRPCYLVVDREYAGSISTRKLVIETARINVITAYGSREAIATLALFPNLDGVVLDDHMPDMPVDELIGSLRAVVPGFKVVAVCIPGQRTCTDADVYVDSFDPARLLETLHTLHPDFAAQAERQREFLQMQTGLDPKTHAGS